MEDWLQFCLEALSGNVSYPHWLFEVSFTASILTGFDATTCAILWIIHRFMVQSPMDVTLLIPFAGCLLGIIWRTYYDNSFIKWEGITQRMGMLITLLYAYCLFNLPYPVMLLCFTWMALLWDKKLLCVLRFIVCVLFVQAEPRVTEPEQIFHVVTLAVGMIGALSVLFGHKIRSPE